MLQQLTEGAALLSEEVDLRTSACRFLSRHESGLGQISQSLAQHLVAQAWDESSQFRIAAWSLFQIGKNYRLPLSAENGECELGGAVEIGC